MLGSSDGHPVLGLQGFLSGTAHSYQAGTDQGVPAYDGTDLGDLRVSRFVGGLVLGAALTIFALRVAGFRFSFGTSVGVGG